jgi:hypothetical protein
VWRGKNKKGKTTMKTVIVEVTHKLVLKVSEDTDVEDVVNELECSFQDTTGNADVEDSEMTTYECVDSH